MIRHWIKDIEWQKLEIIAEKSAIQSKHNLMVDELEKEISKYLNEKVPDLYNSITAVIKKESVQFKKF